MAIDSNSDGDRRQCAAEKNGQGLHQKPLNILWGSLDVMKFGMGVQGHFTRSTAEEFGGILHELVKGIEHETDYWKFSLFDLHGTLRSTIASQRSSIILQMHRSIVKLIC